MSLFHLVYASSATEPFSREHLLALLEISRRNNAKVDITGMLLYRDGNFMQVLEGEEAAVRGVHVKIARDPRHRGLLTLLEGPIESRSFAGWRMGFRELNRRELESNPGYTEFLNDDWLSPKMTENPGRAMRLLETFRQSMR